MRRWSVIGGHGRVRHGWRLLGRSACLAGVLAVAACSMTGTGQPPAPELPPRTGAEAGPVTDLIRPQSAQGPYPVTDVVDGDTLKVERGGRIVTIRVIGIDTPETRDPRAVVQCFGREASARAHQLLEGKQVWLEPDPSQSVIDRYGRELDFVWLDSGPMFNQIMLRQGYAHEYTYDIPYRYQEQFRADQRYAQEHDAGLWNPSTCGGDTDQPA